MRTTLFCVLIATSGCGAIFTSNTSQMMGPPHATIDGQPFPAIVSDKTSHEVVYADGRHCVVSSHVSAPVFVLDLLFGFPLVLPMVLSFGIDGASGDWDKLDADGCPGVSVN